MSNCQRGPTPAEEEFNVAFSCMRNIDKLMWHMHASSVNEKKDTVKWCQEEIKESVGVVKAKLDQMMEKLDE